jgi:two-component system sensor histidine kinase CreC
MSLTSKLLAGFALISAIGFWLMMDKVLARVERQYVEAEEEPMVDMANVLAEMLARDVSDGRVDTTHVQRAFEAAKTRVFEAKIYLLTKTGVEMDVYVTDAERFVLYDSMHPERIGDRLEMRDVGLTLDGKYGARSTREDKNDKQSSIMFVGAPIRHEGKTVGVVSIAKPQRSTLQFQEQTRAYLKRTIGTLILCMVLGSFLLARWTTRPIRRLTDYAQAIARGEKPPVPRLHGSEMKTLRGAFETMRDVLENRDYVERYVQTLTHELKSPVAAIRGASELLHDTAMPEAQRVKFLRNIQSESLRVQDLLDRLLALTKLEKQKMLDDAAMVDLSCIAREVCERFAPSYAQHCIKTDLWIEDGVRVRGDAFLLETALNNMVQNAVDFSPDGGVISIGLKTVDDRACFVVEDEGPGLPEYAIQRVFERFYSLPRPQTGQKSSGLGLCFVREAALLHGGTAELENRAGGKGARAVLSVPVA